MNKEEVQNLIDASIQKFMLDKQYNLSKLQNHLHNGTDLNKINAADLVNNIKNISGLVADTSETITFTGLNIPNIERITFYGFAANNADASPATKRAICNGECDFGKLYSFTGGGTTGVVVITNSIIGSPLISFCNSMYVDSSDLTKNRVAIGGVDANSPAGQLVRVVDDTSTEVVVLEILSYTYNSITMRVTLGTNWKLQGNLVIA